MRINIQIKSNTNFSLKKRPKKHAWRRVVYVYSVDNHERGRFKLILNLDINGIISALAIPFGGAVFWMIKRIINDQFKEVSVAHKQLNDIVNNHQSSDREQHKQLSDKTEKQAEDINLIKRELLGISVTISNIEKNIDQLLKLAQK